MRTHELEFVPAVVDDVDPEAAAVNVDGRREERKPGSGVLFQVCVAGSAEQEEVVLRGHRRVKESALRSVAQRSSSRFTKR